MSPDEDRWRAWVRQEIQLLRGAVQQLRIDVQAVETRSVSEATRVVTSMLAGVDAHVAHVVEFEVNRAIVSAVETELGPVLKEILSVAKNTDRIMRTVERSEMDEKVELRVKQVEQENTERMQHTISAVMPIVDGHTKRASAVDARELGISGQRWGGWVAIGVAVLGLVAAVTEAVLSHMKRPRYGAQEKA